MTPYGEGWEPGTAEDLVADALSLDVEHASPRMITDWTENGLLGAPAFSKSTQHGSDARLYSPQQRRMFSEMLQARERSPLARIPHRTLSSLVLYAWLIDDTGVSATQARRAWRTWAQGAGKNNAARRSQTARGVVDQFAHASAPYQKRRAAQLLIEQGEKTRRPDWDKIHSVLTEVCSPWPAPGQRIERGFGIPEWPFGVQEAIAMWMLTWKTTLLLAKEQVSEAVLVEARTEHRQNWAQYDAARPSLRSRATNPEAFEKPSDPEGQLKERVAGFVPVLGHTLGLTTEMFAGSARLGARRP